MRPLRRLSDKPVRVIVPFPAGGTTDVVARLAMQKLGEITGQSFVVDNKGGANGVIGSELAARAAPDGYTLLMNTAGAQTLSPCSTRPATRRWPASSPSVICAMSALW
jgi:tripartite-type tricarboxylate transporter receptor subunit TctC